MNARTIPWETIADWYKENEQVIRDVMKFEGLRGAVNEVLRLAPDQPELSALRKSLTAAEQRNAELVELLREVVDLPGVRSIQPRTTWAKVDAALKPTESGASERVDDDRWLQMKDDAERADYFDESGASE